MITKKEAKKISLEVWKYLAEHPKIEDMLDVSPNIFVQIKRHTRMCPLCSLFFNHNCVGCPLYIRHPYGDGDYACYEYECWKRSTDDDSRAKHAKKIVKQLEAWEVVDE